MSETKTTISTIDTRSTIASDPLRRFRFRAIFKPANGGSTFDNRIVNFSGGFNTIAGLGVSVAAVEYREGGYNTTSHKIPGQATFENLTLGRGALYGNDGAIAWMRGLFAASSGDGLNASNSNGNFRCNVTVYLMDHPNTTASNVPRMAFFIHNAWISNLNYSNLDAGSNDLLFEGMTLAHEGLSVAMVQVDATGKVSAAPGSTIPKGF